MTSTTTIMITTTRTMRRAIAGTITDRGVMTKPNSLELKNAS